MGGDVRWKIGWLLGFDPDWIQYEATSLSRRFKEGCAGRDETFPVAIERRIRKRTDSRPKLRSRPTSAEPIPRHGHCST